MTTTTAARRESACPVHFIWDGTGRGRWPVRLSFWMLSVLGMLGTGLPLVGVRGVSGQLGVPALVLMGVYGLGQLLSFIDKQR